MLKDWNNLEFRQKKIFNDGFQVIPNGAEVKEMQKIIRDFLGSYKVRLTFSTAGRESLHIQSYLTSYSVSLDVAT